MTTTKTHDLVNRLTQISSAPSADDTVSFDYAYNTASQRTAITNADGSRWVYQYDKLGQVTSGKKYWADGIPVAGQQFEYAFDDIGNRTETKAGGDTSGSNPRTSVYYPNALNQYWSNTVPGAVDVMGVALATNTVTVNGLASYRKGEYFRKELSANNSAAPVWQQITVAAPNEATVTRHEFVAQTPQVFVHDDDGNLVADGRWNYTWDGENRLVAMAARTGVGPQISLKFEYDAQGRRIRKQVWGNAAWSGSATNDLRFVYDGWNLIAVLSPQSTVLRSFTWGVDLSGSLQGAGGVGGLVAMTVHTGANTGTYFYSFDGNGNVAALINPSDSTIAARYDYGPFGEVIRATGPMAKANPFRFSTVYQDDETDLLMYVHRPYSASTGRFLCKDPIQEQGGLNLYAFVANDPVNSVDFLGLWNSKVHYIKSIEWSGNAGFGPSYAAMIGESDNGVDKNWGTSPFPWGEMDRHLNYPGRHGPDSRVYWYETEYRKAVDALAASDKDQNRMHCVEAAQAFGRGLHSWQDISAHRPWPSGGDWSSGIAHPAWWDDWHGEVNAGTPFSDGFWARYYKARPEKGDDYNKWTGSSAQIASQEAARIKVTGASQDAVRRFVGEVRKHCFCRKEMLLNP